MCGRYVGVNFLKRNPDELNRCIKKSSRLTMVTTPILRPFVPMPTSENVDLSDSKKTSHVEPIDET
eukprot:scaffold1000_cov166-Amphora_coffeaeformis.AAC.42